MTRSKSPAARVASALMASLLLLFPACGGGGGGGGGGGAPPGMSAAPTAAWVTPATNLAVLLGQSAPVTIVTNDDGPATVTIHADVDGNLATLGDQTQISAPTGQSGGVNAVVTINVAGLPAGTYTALIRVVDADNPAVDVALGGSLIVYPGLAAARNPVGAFLPRNYIAFSSGYVFVTAGEAENGNTTFNPDMDTADSVMTVIDLANPGATAPSTVSADVTATMATSGVPRVGGAFGGVFAWPVREQDQGDIDQDADMMDGALAFVDTNLSVTPVLNILGGVVGPVLYSDPTRFVVTLDETQDGTATPDLNGDGSNDVVYTALDPTAPGPGLAQFVSWFPPAPPGGAALRTDGSAAVAFLADEAQQTVMGFDFNGDGDAAPADIVLVISDLQTPAPALNGVLIFAGAAAVGPGGAAVDPVAAFAVQDASPFIDAVYYIDEPTSGPAGLDINGSGAAVDTVPAVWRWDTTMGVGVQTVMNLGPAPGGSVAALGGAQTAIADGSKLFFEALEGGRIAGPGSNGDGDGTDTRLLMWFDTSVMGGAPSSQLTFNNMPGVNLLGLALDGGAIAEATPGSLVVVANEAANADLNGDMDTNDNILLVIDTTTTPPTVHRPAAGLQPFDTTGAGIKGNIPLTGVSDNTGVVVQLKESANGILNGDGDNVDTLLGYVPFSNPSSLVVLDAGGDQVALAGMRIAATVSEAYTADDSLDGLANGAAGFGLRIWDLAGLVQIGGTPSAQQSIPTTDGGIVWVYYRDEIIEGVDLNGDTDQLDLVYALLTL